MTLDDFGTHLGVQFVPHTVEVDIDNVCIFIVHLANKAVLSLAYFHRSRACLQKPWRDLLNMQVSSAQTQRGSFSGSAVGHRQDNSSV